MNASNQDNSEYNTTYDPNVALEFFKLDGELESVKEGKKLFVQKQKAGLLSFLQSDKTYLLVDGKVTIQTAFGNPIDIQAGDIFGEFTPYSTHNATATATSSCRLISISEKQLLAGLKKKPEFLFMLMDALVRHLQNTHTESKGSALSDDDKDTKLNAKMLNELKQKLGDTALTVVPEKRVVFQKGAASSLMYVILEGYMAIGFGNTVIGRSGPGDIVGEIGLVSHHVRTASVIAETRCSLLAINRQSLLELIETLPSFSIALLRVLVSRLS